MGDKTHSFYLQPSEPRPDFRLVKAFLWHDGQNVDTDGDSYNPASRTWTYLFMQNREDEAEAVVIDKVNTNIGTSVALALEVKSEREYLAARCAYFLAVVTRSRVSTDVDKEACEPDALIERMGANFDIEAAMRRVEQSPYSRSTLEDPYPNLSLSTI